MLLHRQHLCIHAAASEDATRYNLNGVRILPGRTEATDGHVLAVVTRKNEDRDEFPTVPGMERTEAELEPFTLEATSAAKAMKALKATGKRAMPILRENVAVDVGATNANGTSRLVVTDLEQTVEITSAKCGPDWPNTEAVTKPCEDHVHILSLDFRKLEQVAKIARDFMGDKRPPLVKVFLARDGAAIKPVRMEVSDPDTDARLSLYVMPYRDDVEDVAIRPAKEYDEIVEKASRAV